jgi:peptide-methionine (R)-S-oxide reductase
MTDHPLPLSRRGFLAASSAAGLGLATTARASSAPPFPDSPERAAFSYEIERSEAEWREMLDDEEYHILREGGTELPASSDLWNETRPGIYGCRGCNLHVYSSEWKVPLEKGWAFFAHSEDNTVMTSIDGPQEVYGMDPDGPGNLIEAHCRRCGSHLGHILLVEGEVLHCINGRSLTFESREA